MNIKGCPRPSKATQFRQSEEAAFHISGLSSGIATHFQPKLFLSYANSKCVSQGSLTELVAVLQSLSCSPQGCTSLKIPLRLLFLHGETNPSEQFLKNYFGFTACPHQTCTVGQQPSFHGRPGAAAEQGVFSWSSPGTQLCLREHHTVQLFKT